MWDVKPLAAICDDERLEVTLSDGRIICAPLWWYPRLLNADLESRNDLELLPMGLSWPKLDEDISVDSIIGGEKAHGAQEPVDNLDDTSRLEFGAPPWGYREGHDAYSAYTATHTVDYRSLIHERVERARDFREQPPIFEYNNFFAATDTMLDVFGLLEVAEKGIWPTSETVGRLWMYGALQALVVQQDAAKQLLACFKLSSHPEADVVYDEIRDLRISAVGHPQNHTNAKLVYKGSTFLAQQNPSCSRSQFHVGTFVNPKGYVHRTIDVPELVARQRNAIQLDFEQAWNAAKADPKFDVPNGS